MNAPPYPNSDSSNTERPCHPERSLAESEANRQTQSKDPVFASVTTGPEGNSRAVVRFFDEHEAEKIEAGSQHFSTLSREAATFVSPGRQPWVAN